MICASSWCYDRIVELVDTDAGVICLEATQGLPTLMDSCCTDNNLSRPFLSNGPGDRFLPPLVEPHELEHRTFCWKTHKKAVDESCLGIDYNALKGGEMWTLSKCEGCLQPLPPYCSQMLTSGNNVTFDPAIMEESEEAGIHLVHHNEVLALICRDVPMAQGCCECAKAG